MLRGAAEGGRWLLSRGAGSSLGSQVWTHLAAVLGRQQEAEDPVDEVGVGALLLQVQHGADHLQLAVAQVGAPVETSGCGFCQRPADLPALTHFSSLSRFRWNCSLSAWKGNPLKRRRFLFMVDTWKGFGQHNVLSGPGRLWALPSRVGRTGWNGAASGLLASSC